MRRRRLQQPAEQETDRLRRYTQRCIDACTCNKATVSTARSFDQTSTNTNQLDARLAQSTDRSIRDTCTKASRWKRFSDDDACLHCMPLPHTCIKNRAPPPSDPINPNTLPLTGRLGGIPSKPHAGAGGAMEGRAAGSSLGVSFPGALNDAAAAAAAGEKGGFAPLRRSFSMSAIGQGGTP